MFRTLLALVLCACSKTASQAAIVDDDVPQRQFILNGARLEEREGDKLIWEASARRADGDFSATDVTDVEVHYPRDAKRADPITMTAPRGQINLDQGTATFSDVRIASHNGASLIADTATYDQKGQTVLASGALQFTVSGMIINANHATLHLDSGAVDVSGPVIGRYTAIRPVQP
jgi:lipopolysaccharide assembly outer membrane protein LptD (OstA)